MATIIIGAGIVGLSTAFFLSEDPSISPTDIHLVEASEELFASASGYAGGYLERGQFPRASASLGDLSFRLHEELARDYNGAETWRYYRTIRMALDEDEDEDSQQQVASDIEADNVGHDNGHGPRWVSESLRGGLIALGQGNTAQM